MRWLKVLTITACAIGGAALVAGGAAQAQDKKGKAVNTLKVGEPAPKFTSVDDQGKSWKSSDIVGKQTVVFYFFPAALTGG